MPLRAIALALLLALIGCRTIPPDIAEQQQIGRAVAAGDCRGVDDVSLMLHVSDAERMFIENCWSERQRQLVPAARATGDCRAVERLPGIYPRGDIDEQRFVYRCWMTNGLREMDACIGMMQIADAASIPAIVAVLRRNEPMRSSADQRFHLIDTASACLGALGTATSSSYEVVRAMAKEWSDSWRLWAEQD